MTNRQMAVAVARFWGLLPHVIWEFPFRYYVELRRFYFESRGSSTRNAGRSSTSFDWDEDAFTGEAV